jgi:hypothetical protein
MVPRREPNASRRRERLGATTGGGPYFVEAAYPLG